MPLAYLESVPEKLGTLRVIRPISSERPRRLPQYLPSVAMPPNRASASAKEVGGGEGGDSGGSGDSNGASASFTTVCLMFRAQNVKSLIHKAGHGTKFYIPLCNTIEHYSYVTDGVGDAPDGGGDAATDGVGDAPCKDRYNNSHRSSGSSTHLKHTDFKTR